MLSRVRTVVHRLTRHRSTRLTAEGIQFLLFTLAVGVAAINTGNNLFYLLLAMMLSLILLSGIAAEHCLRRLEFHRHLPDLIFAGEPAACSLVITNRKGRLPSFSLQLFDVMVGQEIDRGLTIHQLLPGASRLMSYPLVADQRGLLQFDGVRVATSFPFGLFVKKAYYPLQGETVVCPKIIPMDGSILQNLLSAGHEHQGHRRGHGSDLYNLRLYHSGDDSRNIHWGTTAKTSKLIVRETEAEDQGRATIHLSTAAPATYDAHFEESVTVAASLLVRLAERGYHLRVTVDGATTSFGQGESHMLHLLRTLAVCERRDPQGSIPSDGSFDSDDMGDAATIFVRSWEGADPPRGHDLMIIDVPSLAGAPYVV
jgi:uncharacterized protein (DUF58 family)